MRPRFVNGKKCRAGYLAGLRLDAGVAGRFDILRRGYQFFHWNLQPASPADYYFTSIAADNRRAREFLERGLVGMPAYEWIGDFVTLLLPVSHRNHHTDQFCRGENNAAFMEEVCSFLNGQGRDCQLAPCWSPEELVALQSLGLKMDNFRILRDGGGISACGALWDQRCFKQTVIKDYAPWLSFARPAINLAARISRIPHLPAAGSALSHGFVSHFATAADHPEHFHRCIDAMLALAALGKMEFITLGFCPGG